MVAYFWYTMPSEEQIRRQREELARLDSLAQVEQQLAEQNLPDTAMGPADASTGGATVTASGTAQDGETASALGIFSTASVADTIETVVTTPKYRALFTNLGAGPASFELTEHVTWDQKPVQLITDSLRSAYVLGFLSSEGYNIETDRLLFEKRTTQETITLDEEDESATLQYALNLENGGSIIYTWTFHADRYAIDLEIDIRGLGDLIVGNSVDFGWKPRLPFTERDHRQDGQYTSAHVYAGGVLEKFKQDAPGRNETTINGNIDWVASKTKFFTQVIEAAHPTSAAILTGELDGPADEETTNHHYQTAIQSPIPADGKLSWQVYIGPLDYAELAQFNRRAYDMVEISYSWMRWFADPLVRWVIIPYFKFASSLISNYGILIILFAFLVKLALNPLTKRSFQSMAAMRELQPLMQEIQEKYKDNPKKQQEETIKLYRKAKVNPLGGCLPMLLQFPILITLWRYFQNSILIRQKDFLWATDLSAPDYIISLPFSIPFLGSQVAGFVLLMTASMILQMRISGGMSTGTAPAGAPNMKPLMYMMPVMLLFVFNNFASGLSLYYLIYNLLSIGQQYMINKKTDSEKIRKEVMGDDEERRTRGRKSKKRKK